MKNLSWLALLAFLVSFCTLSDSEKMNEPTSTTELDALLKSDRLLGCYSFSKSLNDDSKYKNHADATGGAYREDRFGNEEEAFYFDGIDDFIRLPESVRFQPNTSASLSFWLRTTQTTRFDLFDQRTGSFDPNKYNFGITFNHNDPTIGGLLFCYPLYNGASEETRLIISPHQENFNDDNWHHFVFIKDIENQKFLIYLDGDLWQTRTIHDISFGVEGQLIIGKNFLNIYRYSGLIDDIKIFAIAIGRDDVELLYKEQ